MTKPTIFPVLSYRDAPAAIGWLGRAFSFQKQVVYPGPDGTIAHAELRREPGVIAISSVAPPSATNPWTSVRQGVYVTIADVDAHCRRAHSAGATIAIQPYDTHYGSREYSAWDLEGYLWGFGTYAMGSPQGEPDVYPEFVYRHGAEAVSWLARAFDLVPAVQVPGPDGAPLHAEMRSGDSTIMMTLGNESQDGPRQAISVRVDDPDALFAQATAQGAVVMQAPVTTHYGARCCMMQDGEGFVWVFSTYRPALNTAF